MITKMSFYTSRKRNLRMISLRQIVRPSENVCPNASPTKQEREESMKSFSSLSPDAPDIAWRGCHFSAILLAVLTGALLAYGDPYTQSGGAVALTGQSYSTANEDESGVLVTNSGVFTLSESTVTTSGNTSSSDDSSFYGDRKSVV